MSLIVIPAVVKETKHKKKIAIKKKGSDHAFYREREKITKNSGKNNVSTNRTNVS